MNHYKIRHHFRLDDATEHALRELCRHTFTPKATLMRRYVQEGVERDAKRFADSVQNVTRATKVLASV